MGIRRNLVCGSSISLAIILAPSIFLLTTRSVFASSSEIFVVKTSAGPIRGVASASGGGFAKFGDPNGGSLPEWPKFGDSETLIDVTQDGRVVHTSGGLRPVQCGLNREALRRKAARDSKETRSEAPSLGKLHVAFEWRDSSFQPAGTSVIIAPAEVFDDTVLSRTDIALNST